MFMPNFMSTPQKLISHLEFASKIAMERIPVPYDVMVYNPQIGKYEVQQQVRYRVIPKADPVAIGKLVNESVVPFLKEIWDGFLWYGLLNDDERKIRSGH